MTTHLIPGSKPSFRKYGFKPQLFTHEWQRPTDGNPASPGVYAKAADSVHLKTNLKNLPQVRGSCSSSAAQPSDRSAAASARASSRSPGSPNGKKKPVDRMMLIPSTKLIEQARLLNAQADAEIYRAEHMFDSELFKKIGVAMNHVLGPKAPAATLLEIMCKWDKNGNSKLAVTDFRVGIRSAPPLGFGVDGAHKEIDGVFEVLDKERNGFLIVDDITSVSTLHSHACAIAHNQP